MSERAEGLVPYSAEFTWQHPDNDCPMKISTPFIRQTITARGSSLAEAIHFTTVLAENSPQICDICKEDYRLVI